MTDTEKYTANRRVGEAGESAACEYLLSLGYTIRERNFRCRYGEIDIIAQDEDVTVFVEVKSRTSPPGSKYGSARGAVTAAKQKKFTAAAREYQKLFPDAMKCRTDVIEVYFLKGKTNINHLKSCRFAQ